MNTEELKTIRHSAEHVLTEALVNLYPEVKLAMGPATDEGFYADVDLGEIKISEADFPKIEAEMARIIKKNLQFSKLVVSQDEAAKLIEGVAYLNNEYKNDWLSSIKDRKEPISFYKTGEEFMDLCAGPHVSYTPKIKAFKLLSVAGAYWHGDEKNKMLTRIYGTAFGSKAELDDYLKRQEEAEKRDHRKIGKDLGLFVFSDLVGKGLPLLTPKGTTIRRELERYVVDEEIKRGYQHVITPPLAKTDLYKKSGHYPYYKDTMYPEMKVDDESLILRPMTCPHHFELYKSSPKSYRELPLRIAEISPQFRYEKSGELSGLMRVRMFCLADAHIFVQPELAKSEIKNVLELIDDMNKVLGLVKGEDYRYRLSLGDRSDDNKKYYKDDQAWDNAEKVLREVLVETAAPFYEAPGEAAFYGPKIDVQVKKISGKEETAFTVQYDFVMPKRFELRYVDNTGKEQEPVVIHRSSIGAFERTMAFLIEKYAGAFPVWLSPVQVVVVPIADRHAQYAQKVLEALKAANIRAEVDDRSETMQARLRDAQLQKVPYMLMVGDKEQEAAVDKLVVSVRLRTEENIGQVPLVEFLAKVKDKVLTKSLNLW